MGGLPTIDGCKMQCHIVLQPHTQRSPPVHPRSQNRDPLRNRGRQVAARCWMETCVCVTGATGYVAGHIIKQLLEAGYTVHGTCRSRSAASHLQQLPGAKKQLKLFHADLLEDGSFDEAMQGCSYVLHTASPYMVDVPRGKEEQMLLRPAIQGTENVLKSVNRTPSVKRVVITASTASVFTDPHERGRDHTFTEADWNVTAAPQRFPYFYSKKMAEQRAYEMHEEAGGRWSLCSINPGAIWGPPLSDRADSESVQQIVGLLSGRMWPWYAKIGAGFVDVRDVAKAHIAAMVNTKASGRYLVNARSCYMLDLASRVLRREFPQRWVPPLYPPISVVAAVFGPMLGLPFDLAMAMQFKLPRIDASKAERDLDMTPDSYIPPEQSVRDMGHAVMARGIVPGFEVPRVPLVLLAMAVGAGLVAWLAVMGGLL